MKKLKGWFHFGIFLIAASLAIFFVNPAIAGNAEDAHFIKIMPEFKGEKVAGMYINSQVTNIKKNDLVVWMNGVVGHEIMITFADGKTCRDVTANPQEKKPGFFMDSKNCYSTSFLPYSTTSTLQFVDVGTYEYEIVSEDRTLSGKGKIVVRP